MARPKNPDRIAREDLVTRTIREFTFRFRYVPFKGNSIETETVSYYGNEQTATRKATAYARTKGTLLDGVELVGNREKLMAQTIETYIENAFILDDLTEDAQ